MLRDTYQLRRNLVVGGSVFLLLFVVIAPFYWIFTASIKAPEEIIAQTPTLFPQSFTLTHYDKLLASSDFPQYLVNSVAVAALTMAITVVLSTMAAYSLYRLRFPGRDFLFKIILVTYVFPGILLLIPLYEMMSRLGLIDSLWALVFINVTFAAPFAVWLLQAFFRAIPYELEEAAALDGAGRVRILLTIMLPLALPGVTSIAIYAFITSWTEYMFASVLILSDATRTLPVGLAGIVGQYQVDWGLLLAGATVTTIPVLILFALFGRNFVEGLTAGAVK
ncbi:MAG: carbohydrate ABC transporter permease [Anaerolineae bacterium]|nr:carbohydrate ABC transporter permease [Anaerolineae bacterium]